MNTAAPTAASHAERMGPFVDSVPLLNDAAALKARAAEDGYLFFKGLIPAQDISALRAKMLGVVDRIGWRAAGQDELGGRLNLGALPLVPEDAMRTDIGVPKTAYHDTQRLQAMHALPHHPNLIALYRTLFGREVLVHPRHIARMITSHPNVFPTPPHQDFPLIQGTGNTWTAWIPLGDCPRPMGGLAVLRASHKHGYHPIQPSKGAGGIAVPLCAGEVDWRTTDYAAGDVLTFPSYTIHRGVKSERRDEIRLSLDVRFQPVDEIVEAKSLLPHCDLTWDEIYAEWTSEELKYYWRKLPLKMSGWDDSLLQPKRRIC